MNNSPEINRLVEHLKGKKVLLLTTSNRWEGSKETPKSSQLAEMIQEELGSNCDILDVFKLNIYHCEGNVSTEKGNSCGTKDSVLTDKAKNPSRCHRCWASINNPDDELWKVSKPLLEADVVIFLGSIRWGSVNATYQKLIERLNWLENRWTTLGEDNILKGKLAGIILTGHNWNGEAELEKQKQVFKFYGFDAPDEISFHWQWTSDANDESAKGYIEDPKDFKAEYKVVSDAKTESIKDKQMTKYVKLFQEFINEGEVQSFSDGMNQMLKIGYKIELTSGDTGEIIGFNDKIATVLTGTGLEVQIDINTEIKQVLSQDEPTKDQIKIYNI